MPLSVKIHVFIFAWLNMQHISFYTIKPKEKVVATLDFTLDQLNEMEMKEELDEKNPIDSPRYINFASEKTTNKSVQRKN